jgi:hypothetical protein
MKKSFIIVFVVLITLIALFMFLRPSDTPKLPIQEDNGSTITSPDVTNVKGFSDAKKNVSLNTTNKTTTNKTGNTRPKPTPKPLPYPRISINFSMKRTDSIGSNSANVNNTFMIVMLDIRNYGYKYFDAFPNNFRGVSRDNETIPLVNISTGDTIDDVIPNSSRAKGDLIFLVSKKKPITKIIYSPVNKSENYYIIYKMVSPSEMEDKKEEVTSDEDG